MSTISDIDPNRILSELSNTDSLSESQRILKGRCILVSDIDGYDLEDAVACFESVIHDNEFNVEANLELGYYYFAVNENLGLAETYFSKALSSARNSLIESIIANVKWLAEKDPGLAIDLLEKEKHLEDVRLLFLKEELKIEFDSN